MTKEYFKTTDIASTDDYPYGRLRAHVDFGVEFKPKFGMRTAFTSTNPKTGRVNKTKNSTYSDVVVMFKDPDTGHVKWESYDVRCKESFNKLSNFMVEHYDLFTAEEIEYIYITLLAHSKMEVHGLVTWSGVSVEKALAYIDPTVKAITKGLREKINNFSNITLDASKAEELKAA